MKNKLKLFGLPFFVAILMVACNTPNNVLDVKQFEQKLAGSNTVIIDVRTPQEFAEGHIEGAMNIDFYDNHFENKINAIDKSKTILVYCKSGNRSGKAATILAKNKFKNVYDLSGGITNWIASGKSVE
jgi:rhodanese-related sulfurtransferase